MNLSIDTNAYSELAKGNTHIRGLLEVADYVLVSSIVLGELHAGFALGSRRKANIGRLNEFVNATGVSIVAIDSTIAERYGELISILRKNGTPIPTNDVWIAATALETGSRLLSLDTHFQSVPGLMLLP